MDEFDPAKIKREIIINSLEALEAKHPIMFTMENNRY